MSAADDAYARLLAARRILTPAETEQTEKDDARKRLAAHIRRRLPRVY